MNLQRIEQLIGQYERGETTLEQELELKIFFAKETVPQHLSGYRDLFQFYRKAAEEEIPDPEFDERFLKAIGEAEDSAPPRSRIRRLYPTLGIAAALILMFGLFFILSRQQSPRDTFKDPDIAYAETKRILMKVSGNLNSGVEELANVNAINEGMDDLNNIKSFDEGMKTMQKISVLDKSKDIITQKTNKQ